MHSDELRKYLDIINENSEEVLTEGMLQKLAGLALGTVLALGPQVGEAGTVFSYMPKDGVTMKMTRSQDRIPADAKVVFSIDTVTDEVTVVKGGVKNQEIKPDPAAVQQGKQGQTQVTSVQEPQTQKPQAQPQVDLNNILDQAKENLTQDFYDPESAKFSGIKIYDTTTKKGESIYLITGKVNAKNRMGGYVGASDFYIAISKKDNSIISKDTTDASTGGQLYGAFLGGKYKNAIEKGTLVYNNGKQVNDPSK